jgi:predicted extracellular nuclease
MHQVTTLSRYVPLLLAPFAAFALLLLPGAAPQTDSWLFPMAGSDTSQTKQSDQSTAGLLIGRSKLGIAPEKGAPAALSTLTDECAALDTRIGVIQGRGNIAARIGEVTVRGVVVGDYEGAPPNLGGFYLQDQGDGDPLTSDGIFINTAGADVVTLGEVVQVTGVAGELQGQTQISAVVAIIHCAASGSVAPTLLTLPLLPPEAGVDYLERFEGMLVRVTQPLYVTDNSQVGRNGQVVLAADGRLVQPTQDLPPGGAASPQARHYAANLFNRLTIDDTDHRVQPDPIPFARNGQPLSAANTLRAGDRVENLVGVMTYVWSTQSIDAQNYHLRPLNALHGGTPEFVPTNPRPAPPAPGGKFQVAHFDFDHYFNTWRDQNLDTPGCFPSGTESDCLGATAAAEFERQRAKWVAAITASNAAIVSLTGIENDGYGAASALQGLVDQLNAATAPARYTLLNVDEATGTVHALGRAATKVALIYQPAVVQPTATTAVLGSGAFGPFTTAHDDRYRNLPALGQTFVERATGARFILVVNHFQSRLAPCDDNLAPIGPDLDLGDGQANCPLTRAAAAEELATWLTTDPTGSAESDVLIVGNFNAYAQEPPLTSLAQGGYTNLLATITTDSRYTTVIDGVWGAVNHALASTTLLSQVTGVDIWHINADEPPILGYQSTGKSERQLAELYHADALRAGANDPLLIGLTLQADQRPAQWLYVSTSTDGIVDAIAYHDEDLLRYDAQSDEWMLFFDGSDVGLSHVDVDAFAFDRTGNLLVSIDKPLLIPHLLDANGSPYEELIDDSDILQFIPQSWGSDTNGEWRLWLKGAAVGLHDPGADIDALALAPDGQLLISTLGTVQLDGATYRDEDILALTPGALGSQSVGKWSPYFAGAAVGLQHGAEDIGGLWVDEETGALYLNTKGEFTVESNNRLAGANRDIFVCAPPPSADPQRQQNDACLFQHYLDGGGKALAQTVLEIDAFSLGNSSDAPLAPVGQQEDDKILFAYSISTTNEAAAIAEDAEIDAYDQVDSVDDLDVVIDGYSLYVPVISR